MQGVSLRKSSFILCVKERESYLKCHIIKCGEIDEILDQLSVMFPFEYNWHD